GKFDIMLNEYLIYFGTVTEPPLQGCSSIVIASLSLKGGVGKSTISDIFGYYLDDTVILNIDIAQPASKVNSCITIDYVDYMNEKSVEELINELSSQYRYIIIDTPGDPTKEVLETLRLATKLIIPMTIGKRTRVTTEATLETFFGEDTVLRGNYDVFFFFNAYTDRKKRDEAAKYFNETYDTFKSSSEIQLRPKLGALDASNAIYTSEQSGKSIFELVTENALAYGPAAKKINSLCAQIEEHFGLN
ncbi:MAG: hypothetical protein PHE73_09460, partial [Sulfurovaceae bacterium]|nr:hypothetical protein [Sulfurovaceae bacterium]